MIAAVIDVTDVLTCTGSDGSYRAQEIKKRTVVLVATVGCEPVHAVEVHGITAVLRPVRKGATAGADAFPIQVEIPSDGNRLRSRVMRCSNPHTELAHSRGRCPVEAVAVGPSRIFRGV